MLQAEGYHQCVDMVLQHTCDENETKKRGRHVTMAVIMMMPLTGQLHCRAHVPGRRQKKKMEENAQGDPMWTLCCTCIGIHSDRQSTPHHVEAACSPQSCSYPLTMPPSLLGSPPHHQLLWPQPLLPFVSPCRADGVLHLPVTVPSRTGFPARKTRAPW